MRLNRTVILPDQAACIHFSPEQVGSLSSVLQGL